MKIMISWALAALLCGPAAYAAQNTSAAVDDGVKKVVDALWPKVRVLEGRICVQDFIQPSAPDAGGAPFGRLLAEKVLLQLVKRRDKDKKAKFEIDDRLHMESINYLVTGVYSQLDERVTITAKLINVSNGSLLASDEFSMKAGAEFDRLALPPAKQTGAVKGRLAVDAAVVYAGLDTRLRLVHPGMTLTSDHLYGVYLRPAEDCFAYVFQADSAGQVQLIFPNSHFHTDGNRLSAREERWVPNDQELYELDENKGIETIYVVASREPLPELEEPVGTAPDKAAQSAAQDQLLARFHKVGLMGVTGVRTVEVKRVKPLKDKAPDFLLNRLAADAAHKGFYWTISFEHQ